MTHSSHSLFLPHILRLKERSGEEIPHVMRVCVEYLEANGLETVGIFRRTPSNYTIQQIKAQLNQGQYTAGYHCLWA